MNETIEKVEVVTEAKPYTFRKLSSVDVFLMFRIIGKIGLDEFKACFEGDNLMKTIASLSSEEKESGSGAMAAAAFVALDAANVIINNIGRCEQEIYQLLAQTSNLTIEEITAEGNAVMFIEMVIDFVKKDEFPDFFKVVSKLFK